MLSSIECAGFSKIKTPFYSFNIKNSEALEVESIDNIPREFLRIKKEADKTAIKKAIKDGLIIEGCKIVENKSLVTK